MKAYHTRKLTALLLAAMIIVASIAQFVSAEETVYYTETGFPKLDDVRGQLDSDEIVVAGDVEINMGDIFNPTEVSCFRVESTGADADKVNISIFSAHASDGTVFTSNMSGSYTAYYVVKPVSGHPAYEVNRRITVNVVEQPVAPVVEETAETTPEDAPADDDSEDDPYEEPQADDSPAATDSGEDESVEEPGAAEELPEIPDTPGEPETPAETAEYQEEPDTAAPIEGNEPGQDDEGSGENTAGEDAAEIPAPSGEYMIPESDIPDIPVDSSGEVTGEPVPATDVTVEDIPDDGGITVTGITDTGITDTGITDTGITGDTTEPTFDPGSDIPLVHDEPVDSPDSADVTVENTPMEDVVGRAPMEDTVGSAADIGAADDGASIQEPDGNPPPPKMRLIRLWMNPS